MLLLEFGSQEELSNKSMLKINTKKVKLTELKPNQWNPKLKPEDDFDVQQQYEEVVKSIKTYGLVDPILVRSSKDGKELGYFEIINGYHRFLACQELKFDDIIINDLGDLTDQEAKKLTIVTEEIKIPVDQVKLSHLLKDMLDNEELDKLADGLPYSRELIESKIELLDFDWEKLDTEHPPAEGMGEPEELGDAEDNVVSMRFGNIKDKELVEKFLEKIQKEQKKATIPDGLLSFAKSYGETVVDEEDDEEGSKLHSK